MSPSTQVSASLRTIPDEMHAGLRPVLAEEPVRKPSPRTFDRSARTTGRFTLRQLVRPSLAALVIAIALVVVETVAVQASPLLIQRAIDMGILAHDRRVVVTSAGLIAGAVVLGYFVTAIRIWWTGRLGQDLTKSLRVQVFEHLQRLSQAYFTEERIGRLLTRMTSDIDALAQLLQDGIVNLVVQGFTLILVSVVLVRLNADLAMIVLLAIVPVMVLLTWWFRGASETGYGTVRERIAELLADLQENLAGARIITATNRVAHNEVAHRGLIGQHRDAQIRAQSVNAIYAPSSQAVGFIGQLVVLLVGGNLVLDGALQIGELVAFLLYLNAFFAPIQELTNLYNTYQSGRAAVVKLADLLDEVPTVAQSPAAIALQVDRGAIVFDNVSFGYDPDRPVIRDVELRIAPGEVVAIVGETGAGKSTMAKLLTRNYDPTVGQVLVDGTDIKDVDLTSLRSAIGVVPQEPFLFSGPLRHNLTLGWPMASDSEVVDICLALGLGPLLQRLGSLDARIAERGVGLSAGERQLVALARALVPGPRLLVLDEATSNLDLRSERTVEAALDVALEGRTALLIAHRLSTAERADRVVVMEAGRIVEVGTHAELLAEGGTYARMFATWEAANG